LVLSSTLASIASLSPIFRQSLKLETVGGLGGRYRRVGCI
jgi:hypothetical protein